MSDDRRQQLSAERDRLRALMADKRAALEELEESGDTEIRTAEIERAQLATLREQLVDVEIELGAEEGTESDTGREHAPSSAGAEPPGSA